MKSSELFKTVFKTTHVIGKELMDRFEEDVVRGDFADDITDGADEHVYNITHDIMSYYIAHIEDLISAALAQSLSIIMNGELDVDLNDPDVIKNLRNDVHEEIGD